MDGRWRGVKRTDTYKVEEVTVVVVSIEKKVKVVVLCRVASNV